MIQKKPQLMKSEYVLQGEIERMYGLVAHLQGLTFQHPAMLEVPLTLAPEDPGSLAWATSYSHMA